MRDQEPKTIDKTESVDTMYSRDDWRPGVVARNTGTGILNPGDVLFGAYEITGMLGEGGMGAVYSAKHLSLNSMRAIKVMSANLSANLDAVERFHREAKALLDVHHPAVVRCHDLLRDEHGCIYLVMELIDGTPLSERMAEGPLTEQEVRQLAVRIGGGLEAAHAEGVIHRDLSPDNVVLPEGRADLAKLVDFGIAKILRDAENTMSVGFKGKLAYASPEQLGFFDGEIGPASDFFSLGLLLCGAAMGRRLDMGKNFATAVEARRTPVAIPDGVPLDLRPGLAKLLMLDPTERPRSLEGLFADSPSPSIRVRTLPRRAAGVAAGMVLGVAVGSLVLWGMSRDVNPKIGDVAAPMPGEVASSKDLENQQLFEDLRTRLIGAGSESLNVAPRFFVTPNPVRDRDTYSIEIQADCACYPLVFFIDANQDTIDLLYPNPNEPRVPLGRDDPLTVPSKRGMYSFEAQAGTGVDRLKLILLSEWVGFPTIATSEWSAPVDGLEADAEDDLLVSFLGAAGGDQFWSASPGDRENLEELASLLDGLDASAWTTAETVLHIVR